jgi:L-aminopeptidase/D-esterase-like protein
VARAVDPTATAVDGDVVYVLAGGAATPDPLALAVVTPHVISAAIRDAVRSATTLLDCPALGDPARGGPPAAG